MKYILILCLIISGCKYWDHLQAGMDVPCPEGEHCLDLTSRMGGLEGDIFKTLKPIKGWRQIGCVHSKQLDPNTKIEQMFCEYCDNEDHQMWMTYDYKNETWSGSGHYFSCGTPHPKYKN